MVSCSDTYNNIYQKFEIFFLFDQQMDCVLNSAVLVALYAGSPELASKVEDMTRVLQNWDIPVKYSALGKFSDLNWKLTSKNRVYEINTGK